MDQGVIFSLTPEVEVKGNSFLDLFCLDASVFAVEDAVHEDQWGLGVPFALVYSTEL